MSVYGIRCYYNTGFNAKNIPDSPLVLRMAKSTTFQSNWMLQNIDCVSVRVNSEWEDIKDCDYVEIGTAYYYVVGIFMQAGNCAELSLVMDYLTTCGGISAVTITDGFAKRAHVTNDEIFENILQEPFQLERDLIIDAYKEIKPSDYYVHTVVGATIDLASTQKLADDYVDSTNNLRVSVPTMSPIKLGSEVNMVLPPVTGEPAPNIATNKLPNMALYYLEVDKVQQGIRAARSLGLENAITACYNLPIGYVNVSWNPDGGLVQNITGSLQTVDTQIPFKFSTTAPIKNNKVFALFNSVAILSICSGDKAMFSMEELYTPASPNLTVYTYADPTPEGCPYCQPSSFKRKQTLPFMQAVKGMNWQNTPFAFTQKSGNVIDTSKYDRHMQDLVVNGVANAAKDVASTAGSIATAAIMPKPNAIAGAVTSTVNTAQNAYNAYREYGNDQIAFETAQNIRVPEIAFPRDESIQNYIGNSFYLYRVRISDEDAVRLDRFLTMYGYAVSQALTKEMFTSRMYFNYVQAQGVNLSVDGVGLRVRTGAQAQLENGVRIWHTLPNTAAYSNNPIR